MKAKGFNKRVESPVIKCKLFEDNMGALTMANMPKIRSRTKYIHTKYHYFQKLVKADILRIEKIATENQQADILTKPLPVEDFIRLRRRITGW